MMRLHQSLGYQTPNEVFFYENVRYFSLLFGEYSLDSGVHIYNVGLHNPARAANNLHILEKA